MCLGRSEGGTGGPISVLVGRGRYGDGRQKRRSQRRDGRCLKAIAPSVLPSNSQITGLPVNLPTGLVVLLLNARSVQNKSTIIHDLIMDERADLVCITETWVGELGGPVLTQVCPPGYRVQHQPRLVGRGGGVAIVHKESISLSRRPLCSVAGIEGLFLVLGQRDRTGLLLVYRSPRCPAASLSELVGTISGVVLETPSAVVLGDFNYHVGDASCSPAQDFMASMTTMGLSQFVNGPTHVAGHTLDLVFATERAGGGPLIGGLEVRPLSWTDHCLVKFGLMASVPHRRGEGPIRMVRSRSLMESDGFLTALGEFPVDMAGAPVEALVSLWNQEVGRAIDTIAPKRPRQSRRAHQAPWFKGDLRAMKRVGRQLECKWRKSRSESDRTQVRAHHRAYRVAVEAAKKAYFSASIASSSSRPAELFRVVRGLLSGHKDSQPSSEARCEEFARHFQDKVAQIRTELDSTVRSGQSEASGAPSGPIVLDQFQFLRSEEVDKLLARIRPTTCLLDPCPSWLIKASRGGMAGWVQEVINASLREGEVPAALKEAVVRPLLKGSSLDPEVLNNYRPVANIPFLGKVLERVVADQLQALLDEADYLDPFQSGFRGGFGTETALVALMDDLLRERDRGNASLLILLDLSAAFDTIDHGILLERLRGLGLGGPVLQWFSSYLRGRFQRIVMGDFCSAPWELSCGVPQGSILSPMLFNIYMKPLGEVIRRFGVGCHQYADDAQLYLSIPSESGEAVEVLDRCLGAVMGWMWVNKLKLNPDKTEVLCVTGPRVQEVKRHPVLDGAVLPQKGQVRDLGVLLDSSLSLENHVAATARSAYHHLRLARQFRPFLDRDSLATVIHALVTSRLDYCNALYVGLPLKTVRKLELVQNAAARLLTGVSGRTHITPVLKELHWLPIRYRAQFKVLMLTYKALNGLGPAYLRERLLPYRPVRALRSQGEGLLVVPPLSAMRREGTRRRAFTGVAPRLWNSLPLEARQAPTLYQFRRLIKTHLFTQAFDF